MMPDFIWIMASFSKLHVRRNVRCIDLFIEGFFWGFFEDYSWRRHLCVISMDEVVIDIPRWLTQLNVILRRISTEVGARWLAIYGSVINIYISLCSPRKAVFNVSLFLIFLIQRTLWCLRVKAALNFRVYFIGWSKISRSRINNYVIENRLNSELINF